MTEAYADETVLRAARVQLGYGNLPAVVHDADLGVAPGEITTLIGPNGSGKSTILKAFAGALRPRSGSVCLGGQAIHHYSRKALARRIAFLPQGPSAPGDLTVTDLVAYGRNPHLSWSGRMTPKDRAAVDDAIAKTRLSSLRHRTIGALSGGERQRAFLALALAQEPQILLLDEPTTFLDICCQFEMLELVKELNRCLGITVLMVLHDLNQAARYAHSIAAVHQGRIVSVGAPKLIITPGLLEEIFNIRVEVLTDIRHGCPYFIPIESLRRPETGDSNFIYNKNRGEER